MFAAHITTAEIALIALIGVAAFGALLYTMHLAGAFGSHQGARVSKTADTDPRNDA